MFYLLERIEKTCNEIAKNVYRNEISLENYMYIDGNYHNIDLIKDAPKERWREFKSGDLWGGKDCHG